jgi:hypothetical protein
MCLKYLKVSVIANHSCSVSGLSVSDFLAEKSQRFVVLCDYATNLLFTGIGIDVERFVKLWVSYHDALCQDILHLHEYFFLCG